MSKIQEDAKFLLEEIDKKASNAEIIEMRELMKKMPSKKEVSEIRADLFGSMEQFSADNARFKREFDQ